MEKHFKFLLGGKTENIIQSKLKVRIEILALFFSKFSQSRSSISLIDSVALGPCLAGLSRFWLDLAYSHGLVYMRLRHSLGVCLVVHVCSLCVWSGAVCVHLCRL